MEKSRTLALEVSKAIKELDSIVQGRTKGDLNTFEAIAALEELYKSPRFRLIRNVTTSLVSANVKDPQNISIVE